jgi:hypothetical protein
VVLFSQVQKAALLEQCVDSQPLHHLHGNSHMLSRLLIIRTNGQQLVQMHIQSINLWCSNPRATTHCWLSLSYWWDASIIECRCLMLVRDQRLLND